MKPRITQRQKTRWATVIFLLVHTAACETRQPPDPVSHPWLPPDFAIQFFVEGNPHSTNPLTQTAQFVVEPNRQLRVALGPDAAVDSYPDQPTTISRAEYFDLSQHIMRHHLLAEPTSPAAEDNVQDEVRYDVLIMANGRTHRYTTTPPDSPPTVQLLVKLTQLRPPSRANPYP